MNKFVFCINKPELHMVVKMTKNVALRRHELVPKPNSCQRGTSFFDFFIPCAIRDWIFKLFNFRFKKCNWAAYLFIFMVFNFNNLKNSLSKVWILTSSRIARILFKKLYDKKILWGSRFFTSKALANWCYVWLGPVFFRNKVNVDPQYHLFCEEV